MSVVMNEPSVLQPADILEAMERILGSDEFHDSDRLQAILRYVVEETLAGRQQGIKATTIAKEVFERDIEADSESGSIVRVSAARLRRKLSHYYASSGADDTVHIEIAPGSYVPTFITPGDTTARPDPETPATTPKTRAVSKAKGSLPSQRPGWIAAAITIVLLAVTAWNFLPNEPLRPLEISAPISKPFVVVMPLRVLSTEQDTAKLAAGYLDAVITDLSKVSGLSVMAPNSARGAAKEELSLLALRADQGVSHVLRGSLESKANSVRVSVQLIDTGTGETVWAERFQGTLDDWFNLEERLAKRVATALSVTLHPDESRRIYLRHTNNREAMALLRNATITVNPPNERGRVEAARYQHLRTIELDPSFAGGYTGMSQVHSYMVLFQHSDQPEADLRRAITYAQKAIELDDGFGLAYSMLGLAYSLSGQRDLALAQVRNAVALQPGDPLSHQWLGGVLILSGQPEEAIPAMFEAMRLDPIETRTAYLNILGMAYFNVGQYELARDAFERNRQRGGPDAPNMEAYRALTYAALGRDDEAREILVHINVRTGEITPESWIRRWTPSASKAEEALENLQRLGMKNRTSAAATDELKASYK